MRNSGGKRWLLLLPLSQWVLLLGSLQLSAAGGSGHVVTRMREKNRVPYHARISEPNQRRLLGKRPRVAWVVGSASSSISRRSSFVHARGVVLFYSKNLITGQRCCCRVPTRSLEPWDSTAMVNSGGKRWLLLLPLSQWWVVLLGSLQLPAAGGSGHVVTRMRGFDGPLPFYLETGYVEVDEQQGVQLFYYFVRSENDPDEDPLLLWLSGGPGCSGISGLAYEIGPLQFDAQGYRGGFPTLLYRPETWTKVSNIIFVDSPVGTGFSYAKSKEGLKTGDTKAVKQLVIFLRKWLQDHPRFLSNPLYIAGDSYSGFIIPTLTLEIDRSIELGEKTLSSLKGYIAGNPLTDEQFDTDGRIPFLHGMGLVSNELYENARENCGGKYSAPSNAACAEAIQAIDNCTRDINGQHILDPYCPEDDLWSPKTVAETDRMSRLMLESADFLFGFKCREGLYSLSYIWGNDETIQESLGVRKGTIGAWKRANRELPYDYDIDSVVVYHSRLATKGYRALIYSGDHDLTAPVVGTQAWIRYLNLTIIDDWRPWYVDGQVAGFTRSYASGLTYATVKGAGHIAPMYKPLECQKMFIRWISLSDICLIE